MKKEQLPQKWSKIKLEETGEYINGFAFKPNHRESTGLPIIRIQNLTDETKPLNRTNIAVPSTYEVFHGDMLVSWSATLDVFIWRREKALVNQHIFKVNPEECLIRKSLLFYWLKIAIEDLQETEHLHGSTMKHINRGPFLAHEVPLPPIAEQTRIVEKLEELLSDLDAGVSELKAAQKKLGQYRQSLLKAAVEGALTAQWRAQHTPTETGAQLLERILKERRARWEAKQIAKFAEQRKAAPKDWRKQYLEPVTPDTKNLPALPERWTWATLDQLLASLTSGSRDWSPYYNRGKCVFVMAQNVRPWRPDLSFKQFVDPPENDRDRTRSAIQKDDLLLTIVGANTGQICRVDETLEAHFVCQSVALLRLIDPSISEYVNAALNSEGHGQRQFRELNYGAGRPHLSFDQLEAVTIPLPPLEEQIELLGQVMNGLASIEQMSSELRRLDVLSSAQRKNILKAAFSGQLVPQDPGDEPAAVLLERIRAERAAHVKAPKARRVAQERA